MGARVTANVRVARERTIDMDAPFTFSAVVLAPALNAPDRNWFTGPSEGARRARMDLSMRPQLCQGTAAVSAEAPPMGYVFDPAPLPTLPVQGSDKLFPIHRIYCVGRNYDEHTKRDGRRHQRPAVLLPKKCR